MKSPLGFVYLKKATAAESTAHTNRTASRELDEFLEGTHTARVPSFSLAPLLGISLGKHTEKTPLHEPAGQPLSLTEGGRHDFFKSTVVSLGVGMKFSIKFCMMERLSLSIEFSWIFL